MNPPILLQKSIINHHLKINGYYVYKQKHSISPRLVERIKSMCQFGGYERGGNYKNSFDSYDPEIQNIVYNDAVAEVFADQGATCREVFITHEFLSDKLSRNNYLHFDRLRTLKILVYLTDVTISSGPFTVVTGSHIMGRKYRKSESSSSSYENIRNRIDLDYPELNYTLNPIIGPVGTTIVFDTDLFHMGGNVVDGQERLVIRSHFYGEGNWREL